MDEYRPYPAEPSMEDDQAADASSTSLDEAQTSPRQPSQDALGAANEPRSSLTPDFGAEDDELSESDGDEADRPKPNLDHPGGHLIGTVARLNRPRRFGFVRTEDGMEIFFHASALEAGPNSFDKLRSGQPVEFDCHQDEQGRGLAASLIRVTGPAPEQPRQPRPAREERPQKGARGGRGWRVSVLTERHDQPVATQLERLLNERHVKPGQFTLSLVPRETGTECWVVFHLDEEGGKK